MKAREYVTIAVLVVVVSVVSAAVSVRVWSGETVEEVIRARCLAAELILLVDADGDVLAELRLSDDGSAQLWMKDANAKIGAMLGVGEEMSLLTLNAGGAAPHAVLSVTSNGEIVQTFTDVGGRARGGWTMQRDGTLTLGFSDSSGRKRLGLAATPVGGSVVFMDARGNIEKVINESVMSRW